MWVAGFPVLERSPDQLACLLFISLPQCINYRQCLFTREYIRTVLKAAEVHSTFMHDDRCCA